MNEFDINVGEINSMEVPFIFEGYRNSAGLKEEIETCTSNLSFEHKLGITFAEALKESGIEKNEKLERYSDEWALENINLLKQLHLNSYIPMVICGKVYSLFPDIELQPSDKYFNFFFALKINRIQIFDIDNLLEYHLHGKFKSDESKFKRFLTLCIREYAQRIFSQKTIDTINEWMNQPASKEAVQNVGTLPIEKPKERFGLKDIFYSVVEKDRIITLLKNHTDQGVPLIIRTQGEGYIINASGGKYKFLAALKEVLKNKGFLKTNDTNLLAKAFCNEFNVSLSTKQFEDNYAHNQDISRYLELLKFLK